MGVLKYEDPKILLKEKIFLSVLSEKEKSVWEILINEILNEQASAILSSIENDDKILNFLTKNVMDKIDAFAGNDPEEWKKIIKEEEIFLKNL